MIETVFGTHAYEKLTITIIGAGPAGLLTAYRLKKASLNVQVIEARSRIGGRLLSAPTIRAEFGAWSLSNAGKPDLFRALAQELGLTLDDALAHFKRLSIVNNQFVDINPRFIPNMPSTDLDSMRRLLETIISLSSTVQEALDTFYQGDPFVKSCSERLIWGFHGSTAKELSAKLYKESIIQLCLGGVSDVYKSGPRYAPLTRVAGGNDQFVKKMAQYLEGNIELNMPLVALRKGSSDKLVLTFKDGTKRETDLAVLALPVSAYKDLDIEEGLVPPGQLASMRQVCPGNVTKVLVPALGSQRPPGFICAQDYGAAMSEHERFLTLYWRTPFDLDLCKQQVTIIAQTLGWTIPTEYIVVQDDHPVDDYPQNAVFIVDWVNTPYTNGSFCAYSPANDDYMRLEEIEGVVVNSLFKPAGPLYFVGEGAGVSTPPGTLGAAFESAENVAAIIEQRLLCFYNRKAQQSIQDQLG